METEAGDAAVAEDVVQAAATAGDVAEDMEEAGAEEPRPWPMASTFLTSLDLSRTKSGPHSQVRTVAMSMKRENAGELPERLLGKSAQLHLRLPSLMDRPSPSKSCHQKIIMEELAVPLVLAAVPIVGEDEVDADVIDLTLLDTGYRTFLNF